RLSPSPQRHYRRSPTPRSSRKILQGASSMIRTLRATIFATAVATSLAAAQAPTRVVVPASNESVQRFHDIAVLIARQANLKPGQVVVISGSSAYLPYMED